VIIVLCIVHSAHKSLAGGSLRYLVRARYRERAYPELQDTKAAAGHALAFAMLKSRKAEKKNMDRHRSSEPQLARFHIHAPA
jgi:hypothetical protein